MTDWTAGYMADIDYTYGYYAELNPQRIKLAFLSAGLQPPDVQTACELGFGQGVSINLNAAASNVQWYGTDFNPSQALFAQELADASGAQAHLFDQSFEQFCRRDDLPPFDFIALHGIWSWINDENRQIIVEFIERQLKVGGVLYISYNTQPGWASMVPMRELLAEHTRVLGAPGHAIGGRIDDALEFATRLLDTDPLFAKANPLVKQKVEQLKKKNRNYVAHEYFNHDWAPMSFTQMADWLAPAKLNFACSANYLDHIDIVNLSPEQQALLDSLPEGNYRQMVRDFIINQPFRKDYWVKGGRKLTSLQQTQQLRQQAVLLISSPEYMDLKLSGMLGQADLNKDVYEPFIELMGDFKPRTLAEIETSLPQLSFSQIQQAVMVLITKNDLMAVADNTGDAGPPCRALNQHIANLSHSMSEFEFNASPVVGGGFALSRFEQLFIQARQQGHKTPAEWANAVWPLLEAQNQRLLNEGKTLENAQENISMLTRHAEILSRKWPLLKTLELVD
ncbi:class I SAM-dependent methyltransferase [Oceanospirillum beijerinckii]|uniref:class I SAM-dependent methyltransferase n=1 Tax=Oceanospirillum beijerinckii TaxID=64976 RepID=UPI000420D8AF|nr:class I SAM-dependent methyltransferase [Oceanospirillum beijerinckii]